MCGSGQWDVRVQDQRVREKQGKHMGDPAAAPEATVRATQLSHTLRGRACRLSVTISFGWPVLLKVSMGLQASSTGTDQGPHVGPCVGTKPAEHFSFVSTSVSSWTKERTDVAPLRLQGASPAGALLRAQHTTQEGGGRQRPGLTLKARPGCRSPCLHRGPARSDGNAADPDCSD